MLLTHHCSFTSFVFSYRQDWCIVIANVDDQIYSYLILLYLVYFKIGKANTIWMILLRNINKLAKCDNEKLNKLMTKNFLLLSNIFSIHNNTSWAEKWFPFGWKGRPSSMNRTKLGEGRHEMNKLCVNSGDSLGSLAITQIFTRKLHWALQALLQSKLFQHLMLLTLNHAIR